MVIIETKLIKGRNDIVLNLPDEVLRTLDIKEVLYAAINTEDNRIVLDAVNQQNNDKLRFKSLLTK